MISKNKKAFDCGVVAAYNVSTWLDMGKTYKEVEAVAKSCGYGKKGIYLFQFHNLLKKLKIPAKKVRPRSPGELEKKIDDGKLFIFLYTPSSKKMGHVIVAFMDHLGSIRIVNPDSVRNTWRKFMFDIKQNGVKDFDVFEVPKRLVE